MKVCRALLILVFLQGAVGVGRGDISDKQLQKWVDDSALIFTGKMLQLGSNVDSIDMKDAPMLVRVEHVDSGDDTALQKFGSLAGKELTVVFNPSFRIAPQRKLGWSAVFFVNPLLYEKHIAVTAEAVADDQMVKDLSTRLRAAVEKKKKKPLADAVKRANLIVTGVVQEIRPLPNVKIDKLRPLANGRDLYSEHSPRWREAVVRVQSVLKGDRAEKVIVVFPSTGDRMWAESPKFDTGLIGTWLLHSGAGAQLADDRAKILLTPEGFDGGQLKAYTALSPEDFQPNDPDGKNEARIREIVKSLKP
jgi:hypothetical protein